MIGIFTASTFVFGTEEYTYCMAKWNKYLALSVQLVFFFTQKLLSSYCCICIKCRYRFLSSQNLGELELEGQ